MTRSEVTAVYPSHRTLVDFTGEAGFFPELTPVEHARGAEAYLGWGLKRLGRKAARKAAKTGKPYFAMEDAFLRSVGLGKNGATPIGLILDKTGIYYNANAPCDLEDWLNTPLNDGCRARGADIIERLRATRVSKYNLDIAEAPAETRTGKHVVIFDQTAGDASLRFGADAAYEPFDAMLRFACEHFPDCTLWVKTHPDVAAGRARSGGAAALKRFPDAPFRLLTDPVNAGALAERCEAVLTVSSQAGFEALLTGAEVHCFGRPFYAGYGLTADHGPDVGGASSRRRKDLRLDELAYAALAGYAHYRDPFSGRSIAAEEAIETLAYIRDRYAERRRPLHCIGFSGWKHSFTRRCIGSPFAPTVFHGGLASAASAAAKDGGAVVLWASKEKKLLAGQPELPPYVPLYRVEDGFLRSAGLGSALLPGCSLSLDTSGIYYDASRPSDLEYMLNGADVSDEERDYAASLADRMITGRISKYGTGNEGELFSPPAEARGNIHLVIGQVEDDASVLSAPEESVRDNSALVREVRAAYPGALLLYRPHPDVTAGYRKGTVENALLEETGAADVRGYALSGLLRAADHVHTISSFAGFEALCYGKRVHTYGAPFYAGWGLTRDRVRFPRRMRARTPEELIYITLEAYPCYADPVSGYPCNADVILSRLAKPEMLAALETKGFFGRTRTRRYIRGLFSCLRQGRL